jgi:hypothetical protein
MERMFSDAASILTPWAWPIVVVIVVVVILVSAGPGSRDILFKMSVGDQGSIVFAVRSIAQRHRRRQPRIA